MKSIIAFIKGIIFTIMGIFAVLGGAYIWLYVKNEQFRYFMNQKSFGDYKPNKIKTENEDNGVPMEFHVN